MKLLSHVVNTFTVTQYMPTTKHSVLSKLLLNVLKTKTLAVFDNIQYAINCTYLYYKCSFIHFNMCVSKIIRRPNENTNKIV